MLDTFFDLNYGGIGISFETLCKLGYDDIYFLVSKMKRQKDFEEKEAKKIKSKKR